jgi:hypothetical protein
VNDWNGAQKTGAIGINPDFMEAFEIMWRSALAWYAAMAKGRGVNFGAIKDANGNFIVDSNGQRIVSEWGSAIKFTRNPDGTPGLPYFDDNNAWADLTGQNKDGSLNVQYANVFENRIASDVVLAPLLGLVQGTTGTKNSVNKSASTFNQDVWNDFFSEPNNVALLNAWLAVPPEKLAQFVPATQVNPLPPPTSPVDADQTPYGQLNLSTD